MNTKSLVFRSFITSLSFFVIVISDELAQAQPFINPIDKEPHTTRPYAWYGNVARENESPIYKYHTGMDIIPKAASQGTESLYSYTTLVRAAWHGTIYKVFGLNLPIDNLRRWDKGSDEYSWKTVPENRRNNHGLGMCVIIYHQDLQLYTLYGHLDAVENSILELGENSVEVIPGQVIGRMGNSAFQDHRSLDLEPHLHFEVKDRGILSARTTDDKGPDWGYTPGSTSTNMPGHPNWFGYHDPNIFLNETVYNILEPVPIEVLEFPLRVRDYPSTDSNLSLEITRIFQRDDDKLPAFVATRRVGNQWYQIYLPNVEAEGWSASGWIAGNLDQIQYSRVNSALPQVKIIKDSAHVYKTQSTAESDELEVFVYGQNTLDQQRFVPFETSSGWYRVYLPEKSSQPDGWIRANDVQFIEPLPSLTYTYGLAQGWNLISFPFTPQPARFSDLFAGVADDLYEYVYYVVRQDNQNLLARSRTNELDAQPRKGYYVYLGASREISVSGGPLNENLILHQGWNLVGVKQRFMPDVSDIFDYAYHLEGGQTVYSEIDLQTTALRPGKGYWIYSFADGVPLVPRTVYVASVKPSEDETKGIATEVRKRAIGTQNISDNFVAEIRAEQLGTPYRISLKFGVKPDATDGWDQRIDKIILPFPGQLFGGFIEELALRESYKSPGTTKEWLLLVASQGPSPENPDNRNEVEITWRLPVSGSLEPNAKFELLDLNGSVVADMRVRREISFPVESVGAARLYTIRGYLDESPPSALSTPAWIDYPQSSNTGQYTVSWDAVEGDGIYYQLERSDNGGFDWLKVISIGRTSYVDAVANGRYRYQVRATTYKDTSDWMQGTWDCVVDVPTVPSEPLESGIISTVAGNGSYDFSGDGGSAIEASLRNPRAICVDKSGNLIIADSNNGRIRRVDTNGVITTLVDNLDLPYDVAIDNADNLYIAETDRHRVLKRIPDGTIITVAGNGVAGFSGDGGQASQASLNRPRGICVDDGGTLYIADTYNYRIRKVDLGGTITTVAGGGDVFLEGVPATETYISLPHGVSLDAQGNLYIADYSHHRIRKVDLAGIITTVAGNGIPGVVASGNLGDGGPAVQAQLKNPTDVFADDSGNLYIADHGDHRIRRVDSNGTITTFAGNTGDFYGDGGPATEAYLKSPHGVFLDERGNLYIADMLNNRIRKVLSVDAAPPVFPAMPDTVCHTRQNIQILLTATDPDGEDANLAYQALSLPEGAIFDSDNRAFSWQPDSSGEFTAIFRVRDRDGLSDTLSFAITVFMLGDVTNNNEVTALDASWILRTVVRLVQLGDSRYPALIKLIADVTKNDEIRALDASEVLRYVVGFPSMLTPGVTKPVALDKSLRRAWLEIAIAGNQSMATLVVDNRETIRAGEFILELPSELQPIAVIPASQDFIVEHNLNGNQLHVAFAGAQALSGSGELIKITFEGHLPDQHAAIVLQELQLNEGWISTTIERNLSIVPSHYALEQNYPNPFNPETEIRYSLSKASQVRLVVYNLLGQEVRTLVDGFQPAGLHSVVWDSQDSRGRLVGSAVYLYRLTAGEFSQTKKMVFLK